MIDLTGQKFGRLTVIKLSDKRYGTKKPKRKWLCICDCGNETEVPSLYLRNGRSKSCGCLKEEKMKNGDMRRTHGQRKTKLYSKWSNLRNRCYNPNTDQYHNYGGRGIRVCDEWLDEKNGFINFFNWSMENGYEDGLSIDRIDVNGNYEPSNCRWVTIKVQQNNRRNNHTVEINGVTKTCVQWEEEYGLPTGIIVNRIRLGWEGEKLLIPPTRKAEKNSGITGITWNREKQKWSVQIKRVFLGQFTELEDAIRVREEYIEIENN